MKTEPAMLPSGRLADAEGLSIADDPRQIAFVESLAFFVPMWIYEIRGLTDEQRVARARRCSAIVAERGDVLQFSGGKPGKATEVFNALAEGLACAAYQPGGITFAGRHWCTDHAACIAAEASAGEAMPATGDCEPAMPTVPIAFETTMRDAELGGRRIHNIPTRGLL